MICVVQVNQSYVQTNYMPGTPTKHLCIQYCIIYTGSAVTVLYWLTDVQCVLRYCVTDFHCHVMIHSSVKCTCMRYSVLIVSVLTHPRHFGFYDVIFT